MNVTIREWMFPPVPACKRVNVALLLFRVVVGLALMGHGWGKIQNPFSWMGPGMPGFLQAPAAISEFFGGLAWVMGALTRLSSCGIGITMMVAVLTHVVSDDPFVKMDKTWKGGSYELALVYFTIAVFVGLMGSGLYGFDALYSDSTDVKTSK